MAYVDQGRCSAEDRTYASQGWAALRGTTLLPWTTAGPLLPFVLWNPAAFVEDVSGWPLGPTLAASPTLGSLLAEVGAVPGGRGDRDAKIWMRRGRVPERPKGAVCKIAGVAYGGSNPPPPTDLGRASRPAR